MKWIRKKIVQNPSASYADAVKGRPNSSDSETDEEPSIFKRTQTESFNVTLSTRLSSVEPWKSLFIWLFFFSASIKETENEILVSNETFISKPATSYADVVTGESSDSESPTWLRSFQLEDEKEVFEKAMWESVKVTLLIKYPMLNFYLSPCSWYTSPCFIPQSVFMIHQSVFYTSVRVHDTPVRVLYLSPWFIPQSVVYTSVRVLYSPWFIG